MPKASHSSPRARAKAILDPAVGNRARLDFLLALSHELRTPVGIIVGYTSLARQGEVTPLEALDVVDHHATELAALLEVILTAANAALDTSEAWDSRVRDALTNSVQLKASIDSLAASVRSRRPASTRRDADAPERRDLRARAARDELAELVRVHPRTLGVLPVEVVDRLLQRIQPDRSQTATGA